MMSHVTTNESNEGDRNVNGNTCAVTDAQAPLPILSDKIDCIGADDDGDFGRDYDASNNVIPFPTSVSETSPLCQNLPGCTSSTIVEKETNTVTTSNGKV